MNLRFFQIGYFRNTMGEAVRLMLNEMEGRISCQIRGFRSEFHDFRTEMKRYLNVLRRSDISGFKAKVNYLESG